MLMKEGYSNTREEIITDELDYNNAVEFQTDLKRILSWTEHWLHNLQKSQLI